MRKPRTDYHKSNQRRARTTEIRTEFRERLIQNIVLKDKKLYKTQIEEQMSTLFGIGVRTVRLLLQYLRKNKNIGYDGVKYYNKRVADE